MIECNMCKNILIPCCPRCRSRSRCLPRERLRLRGEVTREGGRWGAGQSLVTARANNWRQRWENIQDDMFALNGVHFNGFFLFIHTLICIFDLNVKQCDKTHNIFLHNTKCINKNIFQLHFYIWTHFSHHDVSQDFEMPRCFLSAKIPSAAGGSVLSDDDQESSEKRDDNYNLNSEKHLGLFLRNRDRIREALEFF